MTQKRILLIDNYDSFTHNIVHYLESQSCTVEVWRNDEFDIEEVNDFQNILLSPGPGLPQQAGNTLKVLEQYYTHKNILGICLGHQAMAVFFGATLINLPKPYHGTESSINIIEPNTVLFKNLPNTFNVGRYHSWTVDPNSVPSTLQITAVDTENNILALQHSFYPIMSVQFHPESILTQYGKQIMANWVNSLP